MLQRGEIKFMIEISRIQSITVVHRESAEIGRREFVWGSLDLMMEEH